MQLPNPQDYMGNDSYASVSDSLYAQDSIFFYCVMDRSQEDVDRVKYLREVILNGTNTQEEWEEYKKPSKGALNYSDLNRIEYNIGLLNSVLHFDPVSMDREKIPRVPYFKNLLINVQKVWQTKFRKSTTPRVPQMPLNTFQKWNDIETILYDCFKIYGANIRDDNNTYCGESLYCDADYIV